MSNLVNVNANSEVLEMMGDFEFMFENTSGYGTESDDYSDALAEYYEATKDIDNSYMHWSMTSPKTLEELVVSIANKHFKTIGSDKVISIDSYTKLLDRGMKPTKVLFKLGVEQQLAGILGTLKLSSSAEDIQEVYDDLSIKSCMSGGRNVGAFYNSIGIKLLHNDRYRVLVDLDRNWISERGYGVLCYKLDDLLSGILSKYNLELYSYQPKAIPSIVINGYGDTIFYTEANELPYLDSIAIESLQPIYGEFQQRLLSANPWITDMDTYNDMFDINSNELVVTDYDNISDQYYSSLGIKEKGTFIGYANMSLNRPVYEYGDKYYTLNLDTGESRFDMVIDSEILTQYKNPNGQVFIIVQDELPF